MLLAGAGRTVFDLQGRVIDAEAFVEGVDQRVEKRIVVVGLRPHQVRGQCHFTRAERPDVQMVNRLNVWAACQKRLDLVLVDPARHRVH